MTAGVSITQVLGFSDLAMKTITRVLRFSGSSSQAKFTDRDRTLRREERGAAYLYSIGTSSVNETICVSLILGSPLSEMANTRIYIYNHVMSM